MPFSHQIDRAQGVIVVRFWGVLTSEQIDDYRLAVLEDPAFDPGLRLMVDMRGLTKLAFPGDKIREITARKFLEGGRPRAIVAATPEQYGVARMYASYAGLEGDRVQIFGDWESAADWLALSGALASDPGVPASDE